MTPDERGWCICQLVPGAKYTNCWTTDNAIWKDERPIPPEEEIEAYYVIWKAEEAREKAIETAEAEYKTMIETGYTDSDGITWYCNVIDLAMMVVLNPSKPVRILSMSHGIKEMPYEQFKTLAIEIGNYVYALRRHLWDNIMSAKEVEAKTVEAVKTRKTKKKK